MVVPAVDDSRSTEGVEFIPWESGRIDRPDESDESGAIRRTDPTGDFGEVGTKGDGVVVSVRREASVGGWEGRGGRKGITCQRRRRRAFRRGT